MANSSITKTKTLKHLFFSRSTTDLQECGEKKESRFLSLFKWKEKKTEEKREESPKPAAAAQEHDGGDWNATSLYGTVPRSKKGLISRSELDLDKPKRSSTFSFTWRKKKKNSNLSQSSTSINVESEVRGHAREPDDETRRMRPFFWPQVHDELAEIESVDGDAGDTQGEDLNTEEFTLPTKDGVSVPHIDSSVSSSSGYRTPPEGPGVGSNQTLTVNDDDKLHRPYSKHSERSPDTSAPARYEDGSSSPVLTSHTKFSYTGSSNSPIRLVEGHLAPIIPNPTSTVASSISNTLITEHHPETSPGAESREHSLALHQQDLDKPQQIISLDSTSHTDVVEKLEKIKAYLASSPSKQSCSKFNEIADSKTRPPVDQDGSSYQPDTGFHREPSHVTDDTTPDNETLRKNEENVDHLADPDYIFSIPYEVPRELVPRSCPDDPEIINSTTEMFSSSSGDNDGNSVSGDVPLVHLESHFSLPFTRGSIIESDPDNLKPSYTSDLNCSNNFSDLLFAPDPSKQEQEPQKPPISTSLSFDTLNKSWSPESISATTDHLRRYSYISGVSHRAFFEDHEPEKFKAGNLDEDICDGEGTEEIPGPGLAKRSAVFEKMSYFSEEPCSIAGNCELACEAVEHRHDFETFKSINVNLNESFNRKYLQDNEEAKRFNTEEKRTRNRENEVVHPRRFQTERLLGSVFVTTEVKEIVEEKIFSREFLRKEENPQVRRNGEIEAPAGEVNQQLADLATVKPDTPVLRECVSEECVTAPPCDLHAEVSVPNLKSETHPYVEAGSGHSQSQESGFQTPPPPQWEDLKNGGGANGNVDSLHVDRDDINTQQPQKPSVTSCRAPRFQPAPPPGLPEPGDTFRQVQVKQSVIDREHQEDAENLILKDQSSRDTCGLFREERKSQEGILVCIRECGEEEKNHQKRTTSQPTPRYRSHRSPHAVSGLAVIEESDAELPVEPCPGSDTDMSVSHVGVLSTTFTLRPKVSREGREDGKKVHKVSLVKNSSTNNSFVLHERGANESKNGVLNDSVDGGTRPEPVDDWGHGKYRVFGRESSSFSADSMESEATGSTHLYSSYSSSSEYKPTLRSSLSFSSAREWETLPSAVSVDTAGSHSNTTWRNAWSEVQESGESQTGGRSWAGLTEPTDESKVKREGGITNTDLRYSAEETDGLFSGIFKATRVELSPLEPEPESINSPHDMDSLVDTLKSMAPPVRHRPLRSISSMPFSSLPPIVEDASSPFAHDLEDSGFSSLTSLAPAQPQNSLPPDLGLNWSASKDMRSPLAMMSFLKEQKSQEGQGRPLTIAPRASALNSILMRKNSLPNLNKDEGGHVNGFLATSRLDSSLLFSNYRAEHKEENRNLSGQRTLFRTASLPEVNSGQDFLSRFSRDSLGSVGSPYESFLTPPPSSLSGLIEPSRTSRTPLVINSPTTDGPSAITTSPVFLGLSTESPVQPQSLQLNLNMGTTSLGSPVQNGVGNAGVTEPPGPDGNLMAKYKAFPDAYLTKEKEHGKLNPRPGKMFIYKRPGWCGQRIEVKGDVIDATEWEFPETISIRVIRGGWVLYEKPDFKGEKFALDEGDIELTDPFRAPEDEPSAQQNGEQENGEQENGEQENGEHTREKRSRFVIGSLRRAVRDYSVPEICLFPEENAEGKKVVFRDTSPDARIYGFPIKANSIIINAGLWLVFAEPFFQGVPRVLEVGGYSNPAAWGVTQPYIGSLHPLKIGEPRVERVNEPKLVIYDKPYFTGKSREIYTNTRDFITKTEPQQTAFMYSVGSLKVIGGIWVGYEREGFRGHQYLLEEGEYHDWRAWGGCDSELHSVRVIRTDLSDPMLVMFEMSNDEGEEEHTFEVTEAIPDVELFEISTSTRSIHVISGAWVAYSHVDYSGNQYVLEKGFYNNCADWGSEENRICSLQPILPALTESQAFHKELLLYTEPNFQGTCQVHCESEEFLPERRAVQSCRVVGGSWVLFDGNSFSGNQYILSEGDYANLTSMGCSDTCVLKSVKPVPILFTVPAISLFGLECFEGREVSMETEVSSMMEGGFNPHFLSVRVNNGCWVLCEHSNYRGRQFLLEPMEITNWPKFSSLASVGSLYPVREKSRVFRIRHKESGLCMSVQGGVDSMKTGRVVVSESVEGQSDAWFYQDGLLKNKLAQTLSLQVVGNVEPGAKVVLWSETRTPVQMWSATLSGPISSVTFSGLLLDVKGGKTYDKEHVIVRHGTEDAPTPLWDIEFL